MGALDMIGSHDILRAESTPQQCECRCTMSLLKCEHRLCERRRKRGGRTIGVGEKFQLARVLPCVGLDLTDGRTS